MNEDERIIVTETPNTTTIWYSPMKILVCLMVEFEIISSKWMSISV